MVKDWDNVTADEAREALARYEKDKRRYYTTSMLRGKKIKWALKGKEELFSSEEDAKYWSYQAGLLESWAQEDPWIRTKLDRIELD